MNGSQPKIRRHPVADGAGIVAVSGELDLYDAPELSDQLLDSIRDGCREVVVDLSDATFIDSTTLGVLILAHKRLQPLGGRVSVVCRDPSMLRLFRITAFDRMFVIRQSLSEAVEAIAGAINEYDGAHAYSA